MLSEWRKPKPKLEILFAYRPDPDPHWHTESWKHSPPRAYSHVLLRFQKVCKDYSFYYKQNWLLQCTIRILTFQIIQNFFYSIPQKVAAGFYMNWKDRTAQKTFTFLLFCWGHVVLAPPSGQEYVVADLNESGLQSKTDGGRRGREQKGDEGKREQKDGKKLSITGKNNIFSPHLSLHSSLSLTLLSIPLIPPFLLSFFPSMNTDIFYQSILFCHC